MIFILIGSIVGVVMGITGAGGAIIAIPLFQIFLNSTMKEATVLSLIAVLFGTTVNIFGRTSEVKWKISLGLAIFGSLANYLSLPLKQKVPEVVIVILLMMIGSFSIWSVWKTSKDVQVSKGKISLFKIAIIGLLLGLITTLTGLGGGVVLIPILLRLFGMTYELALPTSLATITFISLSALILQGHQTVELITFTEMSLIGLGALTGFGILTFSLKSMNNDNKLRLRKIVFSIATLLSLVIVAMKNF